MLSSSHMRPINRTGNALRAFVAVAVAILTATNWGMSFYALSLSQQHLRDAVDDVTRPSQQLADRRSRNITEFPSFMLQWPTDPLPPSDCDIRNASMPHIFNVSDFPRWHLKEAMLQVDHGNLSEAWETTTLTSGQDNTNQIQTAACSLANYYHVDHFPHQMEIIYRCWSVWRHFPNATRVFLIRPAKFYKFVDYSAFSRGMAKVLQYNNISVLRKRTEDYKQQQISQNRNLLLVFAGQNFKFKAACDDDMADLRRSTLMALGLQRYLHDACGGGQGMGLPRIAVFNRKKRRALLGAHNVSIMLQDELDLPYRPPVIFFEDMSFEEQVEAFSNIDILLSPHGAQLTSIPFLPRCASVVEVFGYGYGFPDYFGRLAAISAVNHSYIYLGTDMETETRDMVAADLLETARRASLCAPAHRMVEAVRIQVEQWNRCCGFVG